MGRSSREREVQEAASEVCADPIESARAAGLRYTTDNGPGIRRVQEKGGFVYRDADGRLLKDAEELARIRSLTIPPAWTDVWICPSPRGHLQATGRDARGRKQYRYHPRWRETRDEVKYGRLEKFGGALPAMREKVSEHLKLAGLPREKVLATVVRLLEQTLIRIGNGEYARSNGSYGLTTLRDRHVSVNGATARFSFNGKSGKKHSIMVTDRKITRIVKRCQDIPGQILFKYIDDDGLAHPIGSTDVNEYLRELSGEDYTAKDFRTWGGTVAALMALRDRQEAETATARKHNVVDAIRLVAEVLGNTPAVCRKCYIHPVLIASYESGDFPVRLAASEKAAARCRSAWLTPDERVLLEFLGSAQTV
jgi:DNA topoisomerase-1